jgi:subtilisin family serine protease
MAVFPTELEHSPGVIMTLEPGRLLVAGQPTAALNAADMGNVLQDTGLVLEETDDPGARAHTEASGRSQAVDIINHSDQYYWVRTPDGRSIDDAQVTMLSNHPQVDWVAPVYRVGEGQGRGSLVSPLPNALVIEPRPEADAAVVENRVREFGLEEVPSKSQYLPGLQFWVLPDLSQGNAYDVRTRLLDAASEVLAAVYFEIMPMVVPLTSAPNDPIFPQQWDMIRIAAGGGGITGWDFSIGQGNVVVCVLDTGVDLDHPDLKPFAGSGINLGSMGGTGAPTGNHGTACAGIVAARYNNGLGLAGVAGGCSILPVAFQNWTDVEVALGITWATYHGASVISMSFGEYAVGDRDENGNPLGPTGWNFAPIERAIAAAVASDVVLCAGTGNENTGTVNRYPARNPAVIACGASDQNDNRKSPGSPDGENWWGSNFGPGTSVVAPGVLINTTDRHGAVGYSLEDYFDRFNGTSAATPHVAGLAALIRSTDGTLSAQAVRDIIEITTDKVGVQPYAPQAGFPNGRRNQQMGYGRINVWNCFIRMIGNWHYADLTNAAGAPANAVGDPTCLFDTTSSVQHVYYRGGDGHIHALWWAPGGNWQYGDLTNWAGAPANAVGDPTCLFDTTSSVQHVYYRGGDGHIDELWWAPAGNWQRNDLTIASGAPDNAVGDPTCLFDTTSSVQHVYYRGSDSHIHALWWP